MIFIHSSFRTSSTYIWSKIRECSNTVAYCEIFNEVLESATISSISLNSPTSWYSKHPHGAPYFLEFLPFMRDGGGVLGFDPSFSFMRYIPEGGPSGNISEQEKKYIIELYSHAERLKKIPVLTATRSLGRVSGIKSSIPGFHILIYRNLFQQWCSYSDQYRKGNRYFLSTIDLIIANSKHDNFIMVIDDLFPDRECSEKNINTFYRFIFIHIYLYGHAACAADLIIDTNLLAEDINYRRSIELNFLDHELMLDFSDAKNQISFSSINIGNESEFQQYMVSIGGLIQNHISHDKGRDFVKKIIKDLCEEIKYNEFHTKEIKSILQAVSKDRDSAVAAAAEAQAQRDAMRVERDIARKSEILPISPLETVPDRQNTEK